MLRARPVPPLLLAALLVGGCLQGNTFGTAQQLEPTASARAHAWEASARLGRAACVEGQYHGWMPNALDMDPLGSERDRPVREPGTNHSIWKRGERDPHVGDGRCEVWAFRYSSTGRPDAKVFYVPRAGGPGFELDAVPTSSANYSSLPPVGDWRVDSPRALQVAKEHHSGFVRAVGEPGFGVVVVLAASSPRPLWIITGGSDPTAAEFQIRVDASDGSLQSTGSA